VAKKTAPEPIVEALAIAVPPEQAWEALTGSRLLGDIVMGHVEMDWRPGRPFTWHWGMWEKAAPRARPGEFTWKGTVLDAVPGSTLVLGGAGQSLAVLTVKGEGGASLVTVVQADAPKPFDLEEYRYGWADFLLKLKTLLERPPGAANTYLRTLVRATPAEILRAWLSPAAMSKILPGKVKLQAKTGGRFEWAWKHDGAMNSGRFLEIEKGRRISFTWEGTHAPSEVRLSAERTPYGALVALEHLGVAPARTHNERRWAHLLERLRAYFFFGKKIRTT
jgi:uncharacterized protein YndB with AHSA1/START domain